MEETQDDFKRLLERLSPDPEVAWELYRTLWQKLATFFGRCPSPSDHADEALSRIARRDDLNAIRDVTAFAYGVAKKMRFEIFERMKREEPFTDGSNTKKGRAIEDDLIEGIDDERKWRCFELCLDGLPADERTLFTRFELADPETRMDDRRKLAEEAKISPGALRVRIFRIRRELEQCARKCLNQWEKGRP